MRTPEFIQRCLDAGIPVAMALTAAKAFEAECEIALEELLDARRAKDRARQAKHREKAAREQTANVMSRDVTLDGVTDVQERDLTCERAQVVNPSSSLRSEGNPPVKPNGLTAPKGAETERGTRLPEGWTPDEDGWRYAAEALGPNINPARELDRFRDYWRAVPGAKGRKASWPATWRNWCRNAADRLPKPRLVHDRSTDDKLSRKQANLSRAFDASHRVAGYRGEP